MKTRIVKKPTVRRNEILESAGRLIYTKGYEQMTIQDILDDLNIAKGTLYHYFRSKQDLLDGFIERIGQVSKSQFLPILEHPELSAVQKLQGFFDTLDQLRASQRKGVIKMMRVWYTDENAIVRQKVAGAVIKQRAPLLDEIALQGIREGVFTVTHPELAGEVILSLLEGMGNKHASLLIALDQECDQERCIEEIISTHAAYMEAVERVLGAPPCSLHRIDASAVEVWIKAIKEGE
jgi:AcrR family transcriptional regulator